MLANFGIQSTLVTLSPCYFENLDTLNTVPGDGLFPSILIHVTFETLSLGI